MPRAPLARAALLCTSLTLSGVAHASPPPRDAAKALLTEVEKTPAAQSAARDALAEGRRALVRAERARLAGDHGHAAALEALALEWAQAAKELARAAAAEARASLLEKQLGELTSRLEQARTLLEQTNARRNRAEAQLRELDTARAAAPPPAAETAPVKPAKATKKKAADPGSSE